MPTIEVANDPHADPPGLVVRGEFGDILFAPVGPPEPEEDLTPEELRYMQFHSDTQSDAPVAGQRYDEPTVARSEVCILAGWPQRHVQIGAHCPHGMLEDDDERPPEVV